VAAVLQFHDELHILVDIAGDALFVEREVIEGSLLLGEDSGLRECMMNLGVRASGFLRVGLVGGELFFGY
jgi:hypothetical protein